MPLQFHNSLTKKVEEFKPINPQKITMYVCGPTVYDRPHIGNARSIVVYDLLYRLLCHYYGAAKILYIRNITDVDDKIIDAANRLNVPIQQLTEKIYQQFSEDMGYLNCLKPNKEPKATENIDEMISMIKLLLNNGCAYIRGSHVYFDVAKYKNYADLSGRSLKELESGHREVISENKKNPNDFVLWKPAKGEDDVSATFDSPWGSGRPGWHIECSAMSTKFLGKNFDIHGGGVDLIFPHHTNEIAQSCCAYTDSTYANYWIHNGFLTVDGEKMSKSLGNFITVADLVNQKVSGEAIRYFLLSTHYRKPLNWTQKGLDDAKESVEYFHRIIDGQEELEEGECDSQIVASLTDDLNTPEAFARLHEIAKEYNKSTDSKSKKILAEKLYGSGKLLGLFFAGQKQEKELPQELQELIKQRAEAKLQKDWALADKIREQIKNKGIMLEDKPDGTTNWKYIK